MSYDRTLTLQHVENEIINFVRTDYLDQIRKAVEQRARIVFIDGTQSSVGFALNKWASVAAIIVSASKRHYQTR